MKILSTCYLILLFSIITSPVNSQNIRFDHTISLIPKHKFDQVIQEYIQAGFRIKKGKLHDNGLLNSHIKFRDGSEHELMTIGENPTKDKIVVNYQNLLKGNETGVYIALRTDNCREVSTLLSKHGINHELIELPAWNYITFDNRSQLGILILIEMKTAMIDADTIYQHPNHASGINRIFFQGNNSTNQLLSTLGLMGQNYIDPIFGNCTSFETPTGGLILILNNKPNDIRGRIKRIDFVDKKDSIILKRDFN